MTAIDLLTQKVVPKGAYRVLIVCDATIGLVCKHYALIENENKTCQYIIECQIQGDLEKFYSATYQGLKMEFYRFITVEQPAITEDSLEIQRMIDFLFQVYHINLKYENMCYEIDFDQLMGGI